MRCVRDHSIDAQEVGAEMRVGRRGCGDGGGLGCGGRGGGITEGWDGRDAWMRG